MTSPMKLNSNQNFSSELKVKKHKRYIMQLYEMYEKPSHTKPLTRILVKKKKLVDPLAPSKSKSKTKSIHASINLEII